MKRKFKLKGTSLVRAYSQADWDRLPEHDGLSWDEVLAYRRVLLISEAGAGKTYECREQAKALFDQGEAAFYVSLEAVASGGLKSALYGQYQRRFMDWLASSSQAAFFFLDSIDELQLAHKSFRDALGRLADDLSGALDRATVVVTSRPIPIDRIAFAELLPIPTLRSNDSIDGDEFVRVAVSGGKETAKNVQHQFAEVELQPLSNEQIIEFATASGVKNPEALLVAIEQKNAHDFARRPQDLMELCDDWRHHEHIRAHVEQVRSHVFVLLSARSDRRERAELAFDKARQGAERIALAAIVGRRLSIRHSPGADVQNSGDPPIDPRVLLPRWSSAEISTLLERPVFGEAGYGRLRFQHRSVMEFLAASQIHRLIETGKISLRQAMRMLFGLTDGNEQIDKPSMRPVAGWLALLRSDVFDVVLRVEPSILLIHGDPESLTDRQRERALLAFIERYGAGQWRGLKVPDLQLSRLAQAPLAQAVLAAWKRGIENPEVREILLRLITVGRFVDCADLAARIASDTIASDRERFESILALSRLGDARLAGIVDSALTDANSGSLRLARWVCANLYPLDVSETQLLALLGKLADEPAPDGNYAGTIARVIERVDIPSGRLETLLRGLLADFCYTAATDDDDELTDRHDTFDVSVLLRTLSVVLLRRSCRDADLFRAAVYALRHSDQLAVRQEGDKELRALLHSLPSEHRRSVFAADLAHINELYSKRSSDYRYDRLAHHGALSYSKENDWTWMLADVADRSLSADDRAIRSRLIIAVASWAGADEDVFKAVREAVVDSAALSARTTELIEATTPSAEYVAMQEEQQRREVRQRRKLQEERDSWFSFWRELAKSSPLALAPGRVESTLWNVWIALRKKDGSEGRWDRPFMEKYFGKDATDSVQGRLKEYWRSMTPTTRSERSAAEKSTYLVVWSIGLMGIYAETENPAWAGQLSEAEASIAARYALLELNGLPAWIDALSQAHPRQVEQVIGGEIDDELADVSTGTQPWFSVLLQSVRQGPTRLAELLEPRLMSWLTQVGVGLTQLPHHPSIENKLDSVLRVLLQVGNPPTLNKLSELVERQVEAALNTPFLFFWLPYYCRLRPIEGTQTLLCLLATQLLEKNGTAVQLIGSVFNGRNGEKMIDWVSALPINLLADLTLAIHRHVRIEDDLVHDRVYSPGVRDYAENGRRYLFDCFMRATGAGALRAKLQLASDALFTNLKDRIAAIARERLAEELDSNAFNEMQLAALYEGVELPPKTVSDMAQILIDRLDDLQELMLRDTSPRAAWAMVTDENALRPLIAREFELASQEAYTVDQESVTADGKETDIRLRSASGPQATIELKIGEKDRSAKKLRDAVNDQLVTKYMAAAHTRAGCLLVTVCDPERRWQHPETKVMMDQNQLQAFLNEAAYAAQMRLGGDARVLARVVDLTPRLPREK